LAAIDQRLSAVTVPEKLPNVERLDRKAPEFPEMRRGPESSKAQVFLSGSVARTDWISL